MIARFVVACASLLATFLAPAQIPADANPPPAAWVRYAEGATAMVTGWLREESETGIRLRLYLDQTRPAPDQPTAPLTLTIWIDADGTVSRVEFQPFAHPAANDDLRSMIIGRRLPVPPSDMIQPLRMSLQLDPRPEPSSLAAAL